MRNRVFLMIAAACVACLGSTDVDELLQLTLSSDRATIAANDTAQLRITLSNHSSDAVDVVTPSCGPYFIILDSLGHRFIPRQWDCSAIDIAPTYRIEAHDSATFVQPWTGEAQATTGEVGRLAAATYSVVAILYGTHSRLESRSVHIEVKAP